MMKKGRLVFFSGKMGAGKTTYAKKLANQPQTFYLSEDELLQSLYPTEIQSINDYIKYAKRLKPMVSEIVKVLTAQGVTVILDFPGNTVSQRNWFKSLMVNHQLSHRLIYIQADDDTCIKHLMIRRESAPHRHHFDTTQTFQQMTKYFEAPQAEEGFQIETVQVS